ncbi:hypothetical protein FRB93_003662 [Tulasnella sp. JGI-2019a]|nr:hypothetical protein FRB93_003662 [Tulasnella sp. JGI-2019a]
MRTSTPSTPYNHLTYKPTDLHRPNSNLTTLTPTPPIPAITTTSPSSQPLSSSSTSQPIELLRSIHTRPFTANYLSTANRPFTVSLQSNIFLLIV